MSRKITKAELESLYRRALNENAWLKTRNKELASAGFETDVASHLQQRIDALEEENTKIDHENRILRQKVVEYEAGFIAELSKQIGSVPERIAEELAQKVSRRAMEELSDKINSLFECFWRHWDD